MAPRIRVSVVSSLAPSWEGETLHVVPRPRFTPRGLAHCTVALPPLAPAGPSHPLTTLLFPEALHTALWRLPRWPRLGPHLPLTTLLFSSPLGSTTVMATTPSSSECFLLSWFCGGPGDALRGDLCPPCKLGVAGFPGGGGARAFIFLLERRQEEG